MADIKYKSTVVYGGMLVWEFNRACYQQMAKILLNTHKGNDGR